MSVPGAAGVRLHARLPSLASLASLGPTLPKHLASLELPAPPPAGHTLPPPIPFFLPAPDLPALDAIAALPGAPGAALSVPPGAARAALPLVSRARALRLPFRVTLLRCWRAPPGGHPDENAAAREVEDAVGALADAGAGVLALSDCGGAATPESLRELVEAAFYLDVAGEAMKERLAVRLGSAALCREALGLGVTRLDVGGEGGLPVGEGLALLREAA